MLPLVADGLEIVAALAADADRTVVAARLRGAAGRLRDKTDRFWSAVTIPDGVGAR